ncbi:sulfurtransferase [Cytobacillus sp. IB215316]|uniref:sulfurtransferase n=1 Tax=Cytobacillus sp. IB215316 TaxID=3097354 RepID=UPI002A0FD9DB|nr:sulfurtransferase [Cytobacillus sp. IB215316]MDX8362928.1 sulfurtransferase [Cytobacillus sp. IB215316]
MEHIVEVDWLHKHISNVRIIDCRFHLEDPAAGLNSYLQGHIPGASYFDLDKDLSGPIEKNGGRHPLPNIEEFCEKLYAAGINQHTRVVAYDDQGGAFASRFCWMLLYVGLKHVQILNGGYAAWKERHMPITADIPTVTRSFFTPRIQHDMLVTMEEVKMHSQRNDAVIIDSRENSRYAGIEEPIDQLAGHIPSSINYYWKDSLHSNGMWKTSDEQISRFLQLDKDENIIVYCGSGVTACPNYLSLKEAGYNNIKLYVGSWSDWISYDDNEIVKI